MKAEAMPAIGAGMVTRKTASEGGSAKHRLMVLGFDLGVTTGVAHYIEGQLRELESVKPWNLHYLLEVELMRAERIQVVFEDSRLQSHIFSGKATMRPAAREKVARDVGGIDSWCTLLEKSCKKLRIPCLGVSPKDKGAKVAASAFEHITGWSGRTNEHERDAAMVARPFRKGFQS